MSELIPVLEIFGPTIQGEGTIIGQKTMFVRTAGCDYKCSWCDSAFTWDGTAKNDIRMMLPSDIYNELYSLGGNNFSHVTLSGGNPALVKNMGALIKILQDNSIKVALETQGSIWKEWFRDVDDMTISPKPPSSGMKTDWDRLDFIINEIEMENNSVFLKVVIFDADDLKYAEYVHQRYPQTALVLQVGNEDTQTSDSGYLLKSLLNRYEWLIQKVVESEIFKDVRVLPQLHTWLWGNKRGV